MSFISIGDWACVPPICINLFLFYFENQDPLKHVLY